MIFHSLQTNLQDSNKIVPRTSKHVFIDESGDPGLTSIASEKHFVICAVIVNTDVLNDNTEVLNQIIHHYFPGGELRSNRIGSNRRRRMDILRELSNLDFMHYTQVIDKSLLRPESGMRYKRSFVKYIHRILYQQLLESYSEIHVIADEYGTQEFMQSFLPFLERNLPRLVLFDEATFSFGSGSEYPFIQVADVIAGSIRRAYSGIDPIDTVYPILPNTIIIDQWPTTDVIPLSIENADGDPEIDKLVRRIALLQAELFIDQNSLNKDTQIAAQVAAVRYLLYHYSTKGPNSYLTTANLSKYLESLGFHYNERVLRKEIIGDLRDRGVIITSSENGIKIPHNANDLFSFTKMVESRVIPYLGRIEKARRKILLATNNELDIVSEEEHPMLSRILDLYQEIHHANS